MDPAFQSDLDKMVLEYQSACEGYSNSPPGDQPEPIPEETDDEEDLDDFFIPADRTDLINLRERFKGILDRPPFCYSWVYHADLDFCPPLSVDPYEGKMNRVSLHQYHSLISSPQFKRISGIIQLSQVNRVFPHADHKRGEHCYMTAYFAEKMAEHFKLDDYETRLIKTSALLHDIGHSPWGHCAEHLLSKQGFDHESEGIRICKQLQKQIEATARLDDVIAVLSDKHPFSCMISGPYGADRIAYLLRDIELCDLMTEEPYVFFRVDPEQFIDHMVFAEHNGKQIIALRDDGIDLASNFLTLRAVAYNKIYHDPNVQILQRIAHKVLSDSGLAKKEILSNLNDKQLEGLLANHPDKRTASMYNRYFGLGQIPLTALALKIYTRCGTIFYREPSGEPADFFESIGSGGRTFSRLSTEDYIRGIEIEKADALCKCLKDPEALLRVEEGVARLLNKNLGGDNLSSDDIAIVVPLHPEKKKPEFALVLTKDGVKNLYDLRPKLKDSLSEVYYSHWALRVAVPEEVRSNAVLHLKYRINPEWMLDAAQ